MAENEEKSQTDQSNLQEADQSTQKTDVESGSVSSAGHEEWEKRLVSIEAQLERERERNRLLEQSLQIQEKYLSQSDKSADKSKEDEYASKELETLDKALDPLFQKKVKSYVDPISKQYESLYEDNDALRFEMFLRDKNPELFDDEDSYTRTMQRVEQVRQEAARRGMRINRVDAYLFDEGIQGLKQKIQTRKQKRQQYTREETRRSDETRAALGTTGESNTRQSTGGNAAEMKRISDKAHRGERLTTEERAKYREYVSNIEL